MSWFNNIPDKPKDKKLKFILDFKSNWTYKNSNSMQINEPKKIEKLKKKLVTGLNIQSKKKNKNSLF